MAAENDDKRETPQGGVVAFFTNARTFLKESWHEVRHNVTWPPKKEVYGTTYLVLVATVVFATYLGGLDYVMVNVLDQVWKTAQ